MSYDAVVIGGTAGLYACQKLTSKFRRHKIGLFEGEEIVRIDRHDLLSSILEKLEDTLQFKIKRFKDHRVYKFVEKQGNTHLYFTNGSEVITNHVVFCCDHSSLKKIHGFTSEITDEIHSVDENTQWKPDYDPEQVISNLRSFGKERNLHICSHAYSHHQCSLVGAFESIDFVMEDI